MSGGRIHFDIDAEVVTQFASSAPRVAYRRLRDYVFGCFIEHRLAWLRLKGTRFGRGGKGIKVFRVGEKGRTTKKTVHYDLPSERTAKTKAEAVDLLRKFSAEIRTGSVVLGVHEFGKTITNKGKLMQVPISARPADLAEWKRKFPQKAKKLHLVRKGQSFRVYEQTGKRKKRLKLRWLLVPKVKNLPKLKFYETWNGQAALRGIKWSDAATKMWLDMKRGQA